MPTPIRCDPKLFEKDLTSQVIIVTGANSGIGLITARQFIKQGATVVLACRSKERGEAAAKDTGGVFLQLDLASLDSVRDFVKEFEAKYDRLDVLVNNAGVMACPYSKTKDGFELQFGCNHLGHFLLMHMLTPLLLKTAEATGKPSRFVAVSSDGSTDIAMVPGYPEIHFDDLNWEEREYEKWASYKQSKLANVLHAMEASKKYPADKLISVSLHPGFIDTNLHQHVMGTGLLAKVATKGFMWSGKMLTMDDGAQVTMHCVLEDAEKMESGAFYSQIGGYKEKELQKGGLPIKHPNPNATPEAAAKLWEVSEKLVGV